MQELDLLNISSQLPDVRIRKIHIRTQQMGRKWLTTIDGLDDDLDLKRIVRALKGELHCSAVVCVDEKSENEYIKLSGNQKEALKTWLIANSVLTEQEAADRLVIHGS